MNMKHAVTTIAAAALMMTGSLYGDVISTKQIPLKNADFAKVNAKGQPEAWTTGNTKNLIVKAEKTAKGNQFVTLSAEKPTTWACIYQVYSNLADFPALAKGQKYEVVLEFNAKSTNLKGYAFGTIEFKSAKWVRVLHRDGQQLSNVKDWKKVSVVLPIDKLPANAKFILASFFLSGTGSVSIDDVKLSVRVIGKK